MGVSDRYNLINGDCLEAMDDLIAQNVTVDAIITDPPYGTTACKWDSVIPFHKMWERLNKLIKPNGAIALFGSEPFSSALRMSNIKHYKYDWVYQKKAPSNFALVKYQPMKYHENVIVFSKNRHNYYPIKEAREGSGKARIQYKFNNTKVGDFIKINTYINSTASELRYPSSVQRFNNRAKGDVGKHPTQKPVALMEYLIKTYTNENETVLDFTMGSGTTICACKNTNRNAIGIEIDKTYFEIAKNRIYK